MPLHLWFHYCLLWYNPWYSMWKHHAILAHWKAEWLKQCAIGNKLVHARDLFREKCSDRKVRALKATRSRKPIQIHTLEDRRYCVELCPLDHSSLFLLLVIMKVFYLILRKSFFLLFHFSILSRSLISTLKFYSNFWCFTPLYLLLSSCLASIAYY